MTKIKVPGKVILIGEYAVLEGAPSVVMAVDKHVRIDLYRTDDDKLTIYSRNFGKSLVLEPNDVSITQNMEPSLQFIHQMLGLLIQGKGADSNVWKGIEISIDSMDFYHGQHKLGFGSSAALMVGMVMTRNYLYGQKMKRVELFHAARELHYQLQQKTGSGVDIAASVFGGVLIYRVPVSASDVEYYQDLNTELPPYCIVWSGQSVKTGPMVRKVQEFKEQFPEKFSSILQRMKDYTHDFIVSVRENHHSKVLQIVKAFYQVEKELGEYSGAEIISEKHAKIHKLVTDAGGAYKPSGAGGGDIGIAFAEDERNLQEIRQILKSHKFSVIPCAKSSKGAEYEECD